MWFFRSPEIVFGEDAVNWLNDLAGERAFIVTDAVIAGLGFVDKVKEGLDTAGIGSVVFTEVEPEPSLQTVRRGAVSMLDYEPDWIIGLGGGSVMDAAKAMWILYERPDVSPAAISPMEHLGLRRKARLICIPTTAGTGSEATGALVLTDLEEGRKLGLLTGEVTPDMAIVDPAFTAQLPRQITADTGMDVLTHAVEGYTSNWANDFTDGLCLKAARMVFAYLPRAVEHGAEDMEAREKMANAASIGGLGFGNSMAALAHALGHSAGAVFHIPHGRITGLFLPYTIEYLSNGGVGRYLDLAQFVGLPVEEEAQAGPRLAEAVRGFMQRIGQPVNLQEAGVSREDLEAHLETVCDLAEMDSTLVLSRRIPDRDELENLVQYSFEGRSIDF